MEWKDRALQEYKAPNFHAFILKALKIEIWQVF